MITTTERIIRVDTITCPECDKVQQANVTWDDGDPWPIFVHECAGCGYVIMESEWDTVEVNL